MTLPPPTHVAFDRFDVDLAGRRLLRDGETVPLEPKAFAVLAVLVGAPGRALGRDDILDAVWGHRHITPGVLNRIMSLLRHALGEDAQSPRYLHTLHGVGYRFDLPAAARDGPTPASASPAAGMSTVGTSGSPEDPPFRDASRATRPRWTMPAAMTLLLAVAALAWWPRPAVDGRAGVGGALASQAAPAPRAAAPRPPPTLIVMPLKAIGDQADADIAAGLSDELISALVRIPGLRVIARDSTDLATTGPTSVPSLVPRLGISHALQGSLRQSGEQLRFHLRLTEAGSGRTLWTQDYDRSAADVLALQRDVAQAVATALTLKLGLQAWPRGGGDAEFLRRFFAAQALLRLPTSDGGDAIDRAETEFRDLVRQRPDDARTHAGLALALERRAFTRPPLADALRADAAQEAALAQRLDPTLPGPYLVQAFAACRSNRWEDCLHLLERSRASGPSDLQPHFQYAMAMAQLGYLDRAEASLRADIKRDPLNPVWRFGLGRVLDSLGRHDEAHAQLLLSVPYSPYARWFNAVWRGDLPEAMRVATAMGDDPAAPSYERIFRGSHVAASRALKDPSLWPQAEAQMRDSERQTGLMNFLRVLLPQRDTAALIAGLDQVRERSYSSWDLLLWTHDLADLRRDPAFQDYLRDNGILAYWQRHGFPTQCRPRGRDGADCD